MSHAAAAAAAVHRLLYVGDGRFANWPNSCPCHQLLGTKFTLNAAPAYIIVMYDKSLPWREDACVPECCPSTEL
jgi:hypothetical protein